MKNPLFLRRLLLAAPILATTLVACNPSGKDSAAKVDLLSSNRDTTVAPGDDFFAYANGNWKKQHPIPASERS
jgi:hypothetical protein